MLEEQFKAADDVRQRQRLQAILLATIGQHGYRDIAQMVGCATSTFALGLKARFQLRTEKPSKITGANAGGPRQLPIRACWATRIAQFCRSTTSHAYA